MKSKKEIEQLALEIYPEHKDLPENDITEYFPQYRYGFIQGYTKCQEDTKQILLDFIKWSNAVDEYGNKLDNVDIDNFLNKQD